MSKRHLPFILLLFILLIPNLISAQTDFDIRIIQLDNPQAASSDYIEGIIEIEYTPGNQGVYLSLGAQSSDFLGPFDIIVENLYLPSESEVDTNRYTISTMYNLAGIGVDPVQKMTGDKQQGFTEFIIYVHLLSQIGFYPFPPSTFVAQLTVTLAIIQVYAINTIFLTNQLAYAPVEPVEQPPADERTEYVKRKNYSIIDLDNSSNPGSDDGYAGDKNACVPTATAISMTWLENNDKIEFKGDASKYSKRPRELLESISGHMKREKEEGTTRENMVRGKLDFIQETNIPLSVKFQSHYIDSSNITSSNKNAKAQNFRREGDEWPDWEFLKQMMKDGEDIEMNYHWKGADDTWYGHSVFIDAIEEFESGKKKLSFSHDRIQGRANGANGEDDWGTFLETFEVSIDTNGAIRFGPDNKYRVHTIAAESPYPPHGAATAAFLNEFFAIDGNALSPKNESVTADNEFIEIGLGTEVTDLDQYDIHFYGSDGIVYNSINLSEFDVASAADSMQFYLYTFTEDNFPSGSGAIAISYSGTLIPDQFHSYGGELYANEGVAMSLNANNLGDLVDGESIGLQGSGTNYTQFTYGYSSNPTPGELNDGQTITNVENGIDNIPTEYTLYQNYPNPFNPSTTIKFDLPEQNFVELRVYNLLGQEVAALLNKKLSAGNHVVNFNAENLPSGIYIYQINVKGKFNSSRKMLLIK